MKLLRKIIFTLLIVGVISGGVVYLLFILGPKHGFDILKRDPSKEKAIVVSSDELLNSFKANKAHWDSIYLEKTVELSGTVKEIKTDSITSITLSCSDPSAKINCLCQNVNKSLKPGDKVTLRGICKGGISDDLFGISLQVNEAFILNRY